ncbi:ribosomal large subunit pseudouridine synthase F [Prochlorococcus marinus str. MIT 9312]|uniref:Pseudouridine synthase n=1 Tax=Prochlorococcus marinus (strain MIT 9312) TaxID=74546 RepID=Q31A32_PROM9|nr:23S rRNA pseudouridine(2604) synthase RluF [Prochlorococcus marinus]ABB50263.1 ribosomal large subunit pseudouridine synthase F [Prochlorococcus marinus str. MIT 9312]KGF99831.1 Ribosomal large subunit pseudouridine synthase F [Prochlorococcus marinus str. MIT 9311]
MATRINKYLSEVGYCSRRKADRLIEEGKVTINGKIPEIGAKVEDGDQVEVEGQRIKKSTKQKNIYLAFNKPIGVVCTTDRGVEPDNIIDFIKYPKRIFPIGRLDKSSEGLIFLTNDGDIVNKILRARNNHEKEYIVSVNRPINREFIQTMSNGVEILETKTKNCFVKKLGPKKFKIILTQGLNRQIRRMCESLGYRVQSLKRVRIMNIKLDLPIGKYREFTKEEISDLNALLKNSSKIFE